MKMLLKTFIAKLGYAFTWLTRKTSLASSEQVHWINHIYDETTTWPNKGMMWANVHGFDEGPGQTYWVGIDVRSFGFRVADYIIKCKNKSTYDSYIYEAYNHMEKILDKMRNDSKLNYRKGSNVNTEFTFKWGGDEKSFDIHLSTDHYAEEK